MAFLLILAGIIGLAIEIFSPGLILPGATGLVSLIVGLFASSQLPVTAAGVVLLILGVGLLIAETQLPTGGIMGVLGVVSLAISGLLLFDTNDDFEVSAPLVIAIAVVFGLAIIWVGRKVMEAHRGKVYTGYEELVGAERRRARAAIDPVGQVFVDGALWRAERADWRMSRSHPAIECESKRSRA